MSQRENLGNQGLKLADEGVDSKFVEELGRTSTNKQINKPKNQIMRCSAQISSRRIHEEGIKVKTLHQNSAKIFL